MTEKGAQPREENSKNWARIGKKRKAEKNEKGERKMRAKTGREKQVAQRHQVSSAVESGTLARP